MVQKNHLIKLADGQEAIVERGDESNFHNIYIVRLKNGQLRVVDKETLKIVNSLGQTPGGKHRFYQRRK